MDWFTIFAVNNNEESFQCNTLWAALKKFIEYKRKGYEIIDIHYRKAVKVDTSSWDDITIT